MFPAAGSVALTTAALVRTATSEASPAVIRSTVPTTISAPSAAD
ncbi:hypothetical protein [Actinomyces sp.]|nr:hypothetical protein [Actinomyces sp.]MDO4899974.1 hypothetical protein [Actinomyces sp.]